MCSRYFIEDIRSKARIDLHPCDEAEVLTADEDGAVVKKKMCWGFRVSGSSERDFGSPSGGRPGAPAFAGNIIFNARSETASQKAMFRESLAVRRLAVPAQGFYEWNRNGEKAVFEAGTGETLYLAGCYRFEEGIPRFVILTTEPNDSVRRVHDRMPLILRRPQLSVWLSKTDRYTELLRLVPENLKKTMDYEQQVFDFI